MVNTSITVSHTPIPPAGVGLGSIERVYNINPAISFRGTTGLYYIDDELNGNTPASLTYVYDDGISGFGGSGLITIDNSGNYVEATTGSSTVTLRRITSVDADVPLPVHLISFTAVPDGNRTLLNWITANEVNCDYFDVERSPNGTAYNFVISQKGFGNSNAEQQYQTYDDKPLQGWNYYRLKQVDMDGRFRYSNVVPVFFGTATNTAILVYPNPTTTGLNVAITTSIMEDQKLLLLDISGRIVAEQEVHLSAGSNVFDMDIAHLAAGTYVLKVGEQYVIKVTKQ